MKNNEIALPIGSDGLEFHGTNDSIKHELRVESARALGLSRYWAVSLAKYDLRGLKRLKLPEQPSSEELLEREIWTAAVNVSTTPIIALWLLSDPTAFGYRQRCALALLKGFLIGGGDTAVTRTALLSAVREEAEKLEKAQKAYADPFLQLVAQAHARLREDNREFYLGPYVALGSSPAVGAAQTGREFAFSTKHRRRWLREPIIMYAGLHSCFERLGADQYKSKIAYAAQCYKIPNFSSWRPSLSRRIPPIHPKSGKKSPTQRHLRDIRDPQSLKKDLQRPGCLEACAISYALYSIRTEHSNAFDEVFVLDKALSEIRIDWLELTRRALFVLNTLTPPVLSRTAGKSTGRGATAFNPPEDFTEQDFLKVSEFLDANRKGNPGKRP